MDTLTNYSDLDRIGFFRTASAGLEMGASDNMDALRSAGRVEREREREKKKKWPLDRDVIIIRNPRP